MSFAQQVEEIQLDDLDKMLEDFPSDDASGDLQESSLLDSVSTENLDDLENFKEDIGDADFPLPEEIVVPLEKSGPKLEIIDSAQKSRESDLIFDVGKEEKDLLEVAKTMQGKIPDSEWNEIAGKSTSGTYEVVKGDWLWKISKNIFGSGFYYSKIWALNPYITNPHEIEPGMILSFSTGSDNQLPSIDLARNQNIVDRGAGDQTLSRYSKFGDNTKPEWLNERERLKKEGVYIQYGTSDTKQDLEEIGKANLISEYEVYEPPAIDFLIGTPDAEFDSSGFDRNAKVNFRFKEGFPITTFISSNIVQDFGKIDSSYVYNSILTDENRVFVRMDENIDVVVGDKFSVYNSSGKISHKNSDRSGYRYTITGSLEVMQKHDNGKLWECRIFDTTGIITRGDRVTVYTPKIDAITKSYNTRTVEAVIISGFYNVQSLASFGDILYLDRGRADGVEVGNVFEVYGFKDRSTGRNISNNPTYKNGELTVLTVTDNFSTAVVSSSMRDFIIGDIAVTKSKESAAKVAKFRNLKNGGDKQRLSTQALEELDVELNLEGLNDSLLDKADQIQFTEDELAELERQEREKSILTENEKDLRSLERLETDLESAAKVMNEAKLDEDKLLEGENLNKLEDNFNVEQQESLDELEENFGKRYLDEDLNDKENPFGLTEFDIEEIDELLNVETQE